LNSCCGADSRLIAPPLVVIVESMRAARAAVLKVLTQNCEMEIGPVDLAMIPAGSNRPGELQGIPIQ
jgi:hypothetical protein